MGGRRLLQYILVRFARISQFTLAGSGGESGPMYPQGSNSHQRAPAWVRRRCRPRRRWLGRSSCRGRCRRVRRCCTTQGSRRRSSRTPRTPP